MDHNILVNPFLQPGSPCLYRDGARHWARAQHDYTLPRDAPCPARLSFLQPAIRLPGPGSFSGYSLFWIEVSSRVDRARHKLLHRSNFPVMSGLQDVILWIRDGKSVSTPLVRLFRSEIRFGPRKDDQNGLPACGLRKTIM